MTDDSIITGIIENLDTGERTEVHHRLFPNQAGMSCFCRVTHAELYRHTVNSTNGIPYPPSFQISVACCGLDSIGSVFDLDLEYVLENQDRAEKIMSDLRDGAILIVRGNFAMLSECKGMIVYDPDYSPVIHDAATEIERTILENDLRRVEDEVWLDRHRAMALIHSSVDAVVCMLGKKSLTGLDTGELREFLKQCNGRLASGTSRASGEGRASAVARAVMGRVYPPIREYTEVPALLISICGSSDMTMVEYDEISKIILSHFPEELPVLIGTAIEESWEDTIEVTLLAGGVAMDRHTENNG